jgi:hypothetical protein
MSTPATKRRLRYTLGYIGLGMIEQAREELGLIDKADWAAPEVVALHTGLFE